jgi:hypothetical protein
MSKTRHSYAQERVGAILKVNAKGKPIGIIDQHKKLAKELNQTSADQWLDSHRAMVTWARGFMETRAVFVDTETTGRDESSEIVEIAASLFDGTILVDSLVKPTRRMTKGSISITGIADAHLSDAPQWPEVWAKLQPALSEAPLWVAYNGEFDKRLIEQSCYFHGLELPVLPPLLEPDLMIRVASWVGDWDAKWSHYKWPKLEGGHRAYGDVKAMIAIITAMAGSPIDSL